MNRGPKVLLVYPPNQLTPDVDTACPDVRSRCCDLYNLGFEKGYLPKRFNPDIFNYKNAVMINTLVPPERIMELRDYAHDYMNTSEHKSKRLRESAGHRFQD